MTLKPWPTEGLISTGSPAITLAHSTACTRTMGLESVAVSMGARRLEVTSARLMMPRPAAARAIACSPLREPGGRSDQPDSRTSTCASTHYAVVRLGPGAGLRIRLVAKAQPGRCTARSNWWCPPHAPLPPSPCTSFALVCNVPITGFAAFTSSVSQRGLLSLVPGHPGPGGGSRRWFGRGGKSPGVEIFRIPGTGRVSNPTSTPISARIIPLPFPVNHTDLFSVCFFLKGLAPLAAVLATPTSVSVSPSEKQARPRRPVCEPLTPVFRLPVAHC